MARLKPLKDFLTSMRANLDDKYAAAFGAAGFTTPSQVANYYGC